MLFRSLGNKLSRDGGDESEDKSVNSNSNNNGIPCVIQLYSNQHIDFQSITQKQQQPLSQRKNRHHAHTTHFPYAALTYQAIHDNNTPNPTLGIWDLRYHLEDAAISQKKIELTKLLLQKVALKQQQQSASTVDVSSNGTRSGAEISAAGAAPVVNASAETSTTPAPITILLTVDLSEPKTVYSTMKSTLQVLVDYFTNSSQSSYSKGGCCTTSIASLIKATQEFGVAPKKRIESQTQTQTELNTNADTMMISLVVAGILPSTKQHPNDTNTVSYVDKQAQNLVFYHLHQFAKTTNCALVLTTLDDLKQDEDAAGGVTENDVATPSDANSNQANVVHVGIHGEEFQSLVQYLHSSALGQDWPTTTNTTTDDNNETKDNNDNQESSSVSSTTIPPANAIYTVQFHPPNSHDEEVISGVMLRNANCEGYWDASNDSLEQALPNNSSPPVPDLKTSNSQTSLNHASKKDDVGSASSNDLGLQDENAWLGNLATKLAKATGMESSSSSSNLDNKAAAVGNSNTSNGFSGNSTAEEKKSKDPKSGKKEKKKKSSSSASGSANAESKDVSSFFENLMKPKK